MEKRRALGKGLSALIPEAPAPSSGAVEVDIDLLAPSEHQPRRVMDEPRLDALAASIKTHGIIQPIVVRAVDRGYQIIAGERRWRAAQLAGLSRVPVVVQDVGEGEPQRLLQMALIENIQREDLNPIEEARAYLRLVEEFSLSQEAIATAVGKDRASVANCLRLLKLPDEVQAAVSAGQLSMGHARALLGLPDGVAQRRASRDVIARALSVRETEALVRREGDGEEGGGRRPVEPDVHTRAAADRLKLALGTSVRILRTRKGGTIQITFTSEDELQRLYEYLTER